MIVKMMGLWILIQNKQVSIIDGLLICAYAKE